MRKESVCLYCSKPITYDDKTSTGKYCNNKCQGKYRFENETIPRFYKGEVKEREIMKKVIKHLRGERCELCGISEWMGKPLSYVLDHKDGNAGNNQPDNLRMICPNCDSQTPTFGGKNKGNGRKTRGLLLN